MKLFKWVGLCEPSECFCFPVGGRGQGALYKN